MKKRENSFLNKISLTIVKGRYCFFALFLALTVAAVFGMRLVKVNNDVTSYLPPDSETRQALDIMDKEFVSYGTTDIMIKNTTVDETQKVVEDISQIAHVATVDFDPVTDYIDGRALVTVTLDVDGESETASKAVRELRTYLENYEVALRGSTAQSLMFSDMMSSQMTIILAIAVVVILAVLTLTSKSFFEIPIFLVTFVVAAVLNMGSNFLLGSISFVTNSIAIVLQLALAIDYAIILAHRYSEESETKEPKEAIVTALSRSIPSILASSLTTISGLIAIMFMQFRIGFDIGIVLTKGIVCSFLTVFLLMPGLLYVFSGLIRRTKHRSYIPSVKKPFGGIMKARKIIPAVGLALIVGGIIGQSFLTYTYNSAVYPTSKSTKYNSGVKEIEETFGADALQLGLIVDSRNYNAEAKLTSYIMSEFGTENGGIVTAAVSFGGLTGGRNPDSYMTPAEANAFILDVAAFAAQNGFLTVDLEGADFTAALKQAYFAYNIKYNGSPALAVDKLALPLFDREDDVGVLTFVEADLGTLVDPTTFKLIATLNQTVPLLEDLLEGNEHARILLTLKAGVKSESKEAFALVGDLRDGVRKSGLYDKIYVFGDMVSYFDIAESFSGDRLLVNLLTIAFILVILLLSFRSFSIPVILILVIQGAIWINFAIYAVTATPMLFMSYLIVSAINMGATIDYAIVVTNRYRELRDSGRSKTEAGGEAISASFPAIMTSSSIMIIAGFIISAVSTEPYIFTIGMVLGSGTIISLILVLFLLPSLLVDGDRLIQITTLGGKKWREAEEQKSQTTPIAGSEQDSPKTAVINGEEN